MRAVGHQGGKQVPCADTMERIVSTDAASASNLTDELSRRINLLDQVGLVS